MSRAERTDAERGERPTAQREAELLAAVRRHVPNEAFPHARVDYTPGEKVEVRVRLGLDDPGPELDRSQWMDLLKQAQAPYREHREALLADLQRVSGSWRIAVVHEFVVGDVRIIDGPPTQLPTAVVTARVPLLQVEVLDLLVGAGLADSRSAAVDWCIRRLATREPELIEELRPIAAQRLRLRNRYAV